MSLILCNGRPVIEGRITLPLSGAWVATLTVDSETAIASPVAIAADGGLSLAGSVFRGSAWQGKALVKVVGGRGGLSTSLDPKSYVNAPATVPLDDVLTESGEALSTTADKAAFAINLPRWVRTKGTAAEALDRLTAAVSRSWRVLPDGTLWIGVEAWPASALVDYVLEDHPAEGRATLSVDRPIAIPGTALDGRRIVYVEHAFNGGSVRTEVWFG